jgi:hypothetical protein
MGEFKGDTLANSREIQWWVTSPPEEARRFEVRNSFTEKWEN